MFLSYQNILLLSYLVTLATQLLVMIVYFAAITFVHYCRSAIVCSALLGLPTLFMTLSKLPANATILLYSTSTCKIEFLIFETASILQKPVVISRTNVLNGLTSYSTFHQLVLLGPDRHPLMTFAKTTTVTVLFMSSPSSLINSLARFTIMKS